MFLMSNKTKEGNHVFPLYLLPDDDAIQHSLGENKVRPNFHRAFLKTLAAALHLPQEGVPGLPAGLTPEDMFHYTYAVFHSRGYRRRYADFLKIDFPRLPLTRNLELFRALTLLGGDLVSLHLMESCELRGSGLAIQQTA
jgi:predicted helicase